MIPSGEVDTHLEGQLAVQFINKLGSVLSRKLYLSNIRQFVLFSGKDDATDVQTQDVMAWRDALEKTGFSANTISAKISALGTLLECFKDSGIIKHNPASSKLVMRPKRPLQSQKIRALSVYGVQHLLCSINRNNPLSQRDFAILCLILWLPIKTSEIAELKLADIKKVEECWVINYLSLKGYSKRQLLPSDIKQVIDVYLKRDHHNRLITKTNGERAYLFQAKISQRSIGQSKPLSIRHIWHIVKHRGNLAGFDNLSAQNLRQTGIAHNFARDMTLTDILNIPAPRSLETSMLYYEQLDETEDNAILTLNYDCE